MLAGTCQNGQFFLYLQPYFLAIDHVEGIIVGWSRQLSGGHGTLRSVAFVAFRQWRFSVGNVCRQCGRLSLDRSLVGLVQSSGVDARFGQPFPVGRPLWWLYHLLDFLQGEPVAPPVRPVVHFPSLCPVEPSARHRCGGLGLAYWSLRCSAVLSG